MTRNFYAQVGASSGVLTSFEKSYVNLIKEGERAAAEEHLRSGTEEQRAWTILNQHGFTADEKRVHPLNNARTLMKVYGDATRELITDNVIPIKSIKYGESLLSRRNAKPMDINYATKDKILDSLAELSMITARNALISVGAPETKGLDYMDPMEVMSRIQMMHPAFYKELEARLDKSKAYEPTWTWDHWPEVRKRIISDGEYANLRNQLPRGAKASNRRARRTAPAPEMTQEAEQ
jgi:hypothetical protein